MCWTGASPSPVRQQTHLCPISFQVTLETLPVVCAPVASHPLARVHVTEPSSRDTGWFELFKIVSTFCFVLCQDLPFLNWLEVSSLERTIQHLENPQEKSGKSHMPQKICCMAANKFPYPLISSPSVSQKDIETEIQKRKWEVWCYMTFLMN